MFQKIFHLSHHVGSRFCTVLLGDGDRAGSFGAPKLGMFLGMSRPSHRLNVKLTLELWEVIKADQNGNEIIRDQKYLTSLRCALSRCSVLQQICLEQIFKPIQQHQPVAISSSSFSCFFLLSACQQLVFFQLSRFWSLEIRRKLQYPSWPSARNNTRRSIEKAQVSTKQT